MVKRIETELTLAETVDRLTAVAKIQAGVINDLFLLLAQHISPEELDALPVIDKINQAAGLMPAGSLAERGGE